MTKSLPGDLGFNPTTHTLEAPLWYPRQPDPERSADHPVQVEIWLSDVRAARNILISYDFERNGYSIQARPRLQTMEEAIAGIDDPPFAEVAFVAGEYDSSAEPTLSAKERSMIP